MSLLSIIQSHCRKYALSVPTAVIGSTDTQVIQLAEILSEVIDEMTDQSKFNVTTQECVFTATPTRSQGSMDTLCPNGYQYAIFETFFDRTLMRPLTGPLTESEWQQLMAMPTAGVWYKFRLVDNELWFDPIPTTPLSVIAFEYMSSWAIYNNTNPASPVLTNVFTTDADTLVFPEAIVKRGMAYRWKQIKGLPYQSDETEFNNQLNNYISRDKVKRRINVSECAPVDVKPGIFVPSNSWNV